MPTDAEFRKELQGLATKAAELEASRIAKFVLSRLELTLPTNVKLLLLDLAERISRGEHRDDYTPFPQT